MTAKKKDGRARTSAKNGRLGGRPTHFTKARGDKIVTAVRRGALFDVACAFGGIHRSTLYKWLKKGEQDLLAGKRTQIAAWKQAMDSATAECEVTMTGIIAGAASKGEWKAAAFVLERRFPERWSRHQTVGKPGETLARRDLSRLSVEELRDMRSKLQKTRVDDRPAKGGETVH